MSLSGELSVGRTSAIRWVREWREPGRSWFRVGREGDWLVAEWEGVGTLRAHVLACRSPEISPAEGLDPEDEEKWRRGPVRALVRHLAGASSLHASAISVNGRALAFLGESGVGKSTCAADICMRTGASLLADDIAEIEENDGRFVVRVSESAHWLLPDAQKQLGFADLPPSVKSRVPARRIAMSAMPLGGIVTLAFSDELARPVLTPVYGHGAFLAVSSSYVRFVLDDQTVWQRDLETIGRLVATTPVYALLRPRAFEQLPQASELLAPLLNVAPRSEAR